MVYIRLGNLYLPDTVHTSPFPSILYKPRLLWKSRRASTAKKPALPPRISTRKPRLRTASSIKSIQPSRLLCIDLSPNWVYQAGFLLWKGIPSYSPSVFRPSVQFSSVTQSCPTLCDPMNCIAPGLPVHHHTLMQCMHFVLTAMRGARFNQQSSKPSAWLTEGVHSILAEGTKE